VNYFIMCRWKCQTWISVWDANVAANCCKVFIFR